MKNISRASLETSKRHRNDQFLHLTSLLMPVLSTPLIIFTLIYGVFLRFEFQNRTIVTKLTFFDFESNYESFFSLKIILISMKDAVYFEFNSIFKLRCFSKILQRQTDTYILEMLIPTFKKSKCIRTSTFKTTWYFRHLKNVYLLSHIPFFN